MLNTNNIKATSGNKAPLLEIGNYVARIKQVVDLGIQPRKPWQGKEKGPVNMIWVTYELPTEFMLGDDGIEDTTRPRWISEQLNLFSMSQENAKSTQRMQALDPKGALGGDWGLTPNTPCTITVVHDKTGQYANIGAVSMPMKGMEVPELIAPTTLFSLDDASAANQAVFDSLPDFLKEKVQGGIDYGKTPFAIGDNTNPPAEVEEEVDDAPF